MLPKTALPPDSPACATVYSVVWPATERLVRQVLSLETDALLDMHRDAHTKRQDAMHHPFFDAWERFASSDVLWNGQQFPERYPTAGSSEAIREIIRQARWKGQDLVIFDGEYEGYEAIAATQETRIHRIDRTRWRETLSMWARDGAPWGSSGAQWWISQPSAIDGNAWEDFQAWLTEVAQFSNCEVWVDLTYVGRASLAVAIDLTNASTVAGVVFSLSKVMGAYYRRIGGCFSRSPVPGLWANRWFKNLDSLYLGQRWLEDAGSAATQGRLYKDEQAQAMRIVLDKMGGDQWAAQGIQWRASDVSLLMYAVQPEQSVSPSLAWVWDAAARGTLKVASRRLCLTPTLVQILAQGGEHVA